MHLLCSFSSLVFSRSFGLITIAITYNIIISLVLLYSTVYVQAKHGPQVEWNRHKNSLVGGHSTGSAVHMQYLRFPHISRHDHLLTLFPHSEPVSLLLLTGLHYFPFSHVSILMYPTHEENPLPKPKMMTIIFPVHLLLCALLVFLLIR